jgi:DNA-binding response OmpR family regulator
LDEAALKDHEPQFLSSDGLLFDIRKRELKTISGAVIELTETESRLLELFLRYPGRVLSRDEITQLLRGHDWSPLDRVIDGHVSRLRRKVDLLGEEEPRLIKSVRGVGYVFTGEVSHI